MKITFEPTGNIEAPYQQHKVVIETAWDDSSIAEISDLLRYALLAWGFHHKNVDELLPPR